MFDQRMWDKWDMGLKTVDAPKLPIAMWKMDDKSMDFGVVV